MCIEYTGKWNGFQFRSPTRIDDHIESNKYDLVKWEKDKDGKEYCFSVAFLNWNGECFDFKSVGLRYLQYHIDGIEEWILGFCDTLLNTKYISQE